MSILDSWIIGISGSFAVFPGISRVAAMLSAATIRGIDRKKAANWVLLLSVPALVFASFLDILSLLMTQCKEVLVTLSMDKDSTDDSIFAVSKSAASRLTAIAKDNGVPISPAC